MGLLGKKKTEKVEVSSLVKILGSGCAKCNTLEDNTVEALKMLGKEMPVEHVQISAKLPLCQQSIPFGHTPMQGLS